MNDSQSYLPIRVLDIGNDFRLLMQLDFKLASCLNVGDTILPGGTGFAFTVVDKVIHIQQGWSVYDLQLNVVEYFTFWQRIKKAWGIAPYSYWDYVENNLKKNQ